MNLLEIILKLFQMKLSRHDGIFEHFNVLSF